MDDGTALENRIYFWHDLRWSVKTFIAMAALFTFAMVALLYRLHRPLWDTALYVAVISGVFLLRLFTLRLQHYGPRMVVVRDDGLLLQFSDRKTMLVPWESLRGITETGYVYIPMNGSERRTTEMRVHYSDVRGNHRWFCVSREVGMLIDAEMKRRGVT
jgi:hypothetical protein